MFRKYEIFHIFLDKKEDGYYLVITKQGEIIMAKEHCQLTKIFGLNVKRRRIELGLTQAEIAEQLGIMVSPDSISRIESGYVAPRFNRIEEIAKILKCKPSQLFEE